MASGIILFRLEKKEPVNKYEIQLHIDICHRYEFSVSHYLSMRKFHIYRKIEMEARRKAEEEERRRQDEEDKKMAAALQVRFFSSNQTTCIVTLI